MKQYKTLWCQVFKSRNLQTGAGLETNYALERALITAHVRTFQCSNARGRRATDPITLLPRMTNPREEYPSTSGAWSEGLIFPRVVGAKLSATCRRSNRRSTKLQKALYTARLAQTSVSLGTSGYSKRCALVGNT